MIPLPERIHQIIDSTKGTKASFLCARLGSEYPYLDKKEIRNAIITMIRSKELVEIEYLLDGKTNESLLLPHGTVIKGLSVEIQ